MKGWLTKARLAAGKAEPHASSAAEWLLDNDYQIQRAILQIREDLPQEFYAKLPGLGEGGLARPRIHQLAHSLLQDSHLQAIGRATCRERVCQYGYNAVVDVSLKKKDYNK